MRFLLMVLFNNFVTHQSYPGFKNNRLVQLSDPQHVDQGDLVPLPLSQLNSYPST